MNRSDVRIRTANIFDIKSLVSLLKVLFCIEEDFVFGKEKQKSGLVKLLEDERACVLVAEVGGQVVAMCTGQLTISTAEGGQALLVEDMVVQEEFRGQGIGQKLMTEIAMWAKTQGVSRLQLLADKNNEQALKFYEKIGWERTQLICLRKRVLC